MPKTDMHSKVVKANKDLYNSMEDLESRRSLFDIPLHEKHINKNLMECFELLKKDVQTFENIKVLDVGTGFGHLVRYLEKYVPSENILGIDISDKSIKVAKERYPGANFVFADFINDFDAGHSYDLITAYSVMHHFYDWKIFLDKIDSSLKKGGVFYIDHEPLAGMLSWCYGFLSRLKNIGNKTLLTAEYHQYYKNINPFDVKKYLKNYEIKIYYQNVSLFGEIYRKYNIDLSKIVRSRQLAEKGSRGIIRNLYLSYTLIGKKLYER